MHPVHHNIKHKIKKTKPFEHSKRVLYYVCFYLIGTQSNNK